MVITWTDPYCGIQHSKQAIHMDGTIGEIVFDLSYWLTIRDIDEDLFELAKWIPGCGFNPERIVYETKEIAASEGNKWMEQIKKGRS